MRIGFTGAQGTGKTSVAEAMLKTDRFKDHSFNGSYARRMHQTLRINESATKYDQLLITFGKAVEDMGYSAFDKVITDRTIIDSLAYTNYQLDYEWIPDPSDMAMMETVDKLVHRVLNHYDYLVYFPVYEWNPDPDGVRRVDKVYQQAIDLNIKQAIKKYGLDNKIITMMDAPASNRVQYLTNMI